MKFSGLMERVLAGLPAGQGAVYLIRFHALVMGTQLMSGRPEGVLEALREPELTIFDFDFATVMRGSAVDLLAGMLAAALVLDQEPLPLALLGGEQPGPE